MRTAAHYIRKDGPESRIIDTRVMREILQRIEAGQRGGGGKRRRHLGGEEARPLSSRRSRVAYSDRV
ncbi:hypothetical protein GOD67_27890 [Sinorhizobium medicae]|nr:hypothetical protein [Sinorhizobium medicae]MDX0846187.1 hypothetical protein [Sinorhizobium medicae]